MKLTAKGLIQAIQSARNLEKLQAELRDALIQQMLSKLPDGYQPPRSPSAKPDSISGAPNP